MNNKRYPMQQQYSRPPYAPQGVPPQGLPTGTAPRNPNGPQNMRAQNGPRQPQTPQSQVPHQPHSGMTGVPVAQHPHPHAATAQQQQQQQQQGQAQHHHQQQQQQQQQQLQFAYQAAPNHQLYYQPAGFPYQMPSHAAHGGPTYVQQLPIRFIPNPQAQHAYYVSNPQQQAMYLQHQGQQNIAQQHQQQATQHVSNYYPPHYLAQARLPMHQAVHAPVQVQVPQVHPNAGHVQQTTQQHSHPHTHSAPQPTNPAQIANRTEGTPAAAPEKKREKKILKIVDPTTGAVVIGSDTATSNTAASTEPAQASATPAEGNGDVSVSVTSLESPQPEVVPVPPQVSSTEELSANKTEKITPEELVPDDADTKSKTARAEFYQKITQASDDGRKDATPSISQIPVATPPSPTPASQPPEQPDSPLIDSSKSQQAAATPAANTSSDDSKDTSLVSVSPTPIECYLTPRKSSPPGPLDEVSFEEETTPLQEEELHSSIEESPDQPSVNQNDDEPKPELLESPSIEVIESIEISLSAPENIEKEDVEDEILSINEKSESVCDDAPSEEQEQASVVHQNGDLDLEDGEIPPVEDEETGAESESGADDLDTNETSDKDTKKEKIKYDREFLVNIGRQYQSQSHQVPNLLPDVAKDSGGNNNMLRSHHGPPMGSKPGGGPRDQYSNRMNRGGGGQGAKPGMGGMMGLGYSNRGPQHGGMMSWPGAMMVPPAPPRPPKVIELTREEVKLHKAEKAWKPAAKIRSGGGGSDEPKDGEEAITEDIVKKTRGILNKLTPENFEKLVGKFMNLPLEDKEERISRVIKVVFEKAVDEPAFSKEYANMVFTVCKASQETSKKFRKLILDQCQQEFQNSNTDEGKIKAVEKQLEEAQTDEQKKELQAEIDYMKVQMRRRSLGNVRFIGELYKLQMLTPKIMVECVNMLLGNADEENLECLCKLLTTVGAKLDEQLQDIDGRIQSAKQQNKVPGDPMYPKFIPEDKWMNKTFNNLKTLSDSKKLSSRIKFALLDVVELRDNHWKPRRDTNAPKTIDEVRRDAYRQEMEEKRQISNLPPPSAMGDQRGGSSRPGSGPSQPKKGDQWNVQNSNKSSRFQIKKPDAQGIAPVLAPPTQSWMRNTSGGGTSSSKPPVVTAPRFMNRFQGLSEDRDRLNSNQAPPTNMRDSMPPSQPYAHAPYPPRRISPAPSSTSSRENSRPVSPKDSSSVLKWVMNNEDCTADVNETVKNIFEEYQSVGKYDDTVHWIRQRFPGAKITDFVDELSRQVGEMSKLPLQQKAGTLVRMLIKNDVIAKEMVITALSNGVIADLPDLQIDVPMAVNYLAQFLVEIFYDERNLDWLLKLGVMLLAEDDLASAWEEFCCTTLTVLRTKTTEEVVRTIYMATKENSRIPIEDLPWLSPESVAQKMVPVLKEKLLDSVEDIKQVLKENSWDFREEITSLSLIEAICSLAWKTDKTDWDFNILDKLLPILPLPNPKLFPDVWKQACDFIDRKHIDSAQKEYLWGVLFRLNLTSSEQPKD